MATFGAGGLFGASTTTPAAPGTSLFGASTAPAAPATGGLFGTSTTTAPMFGAAPTTTATTGGLFGTAAPAAAPATGGLFGASTTAAPAAGGLFGATAAPATGGLFGASTTPAAAPATGGLFGASTAAAPVTGGLFGASTTTAPTPAPATGGLFGTSTAAAPATGLFGATTAAAPATGGLFGASTPAAGANVFGATQPQQTATAVSTSGKRMAFPHSAIASIESAFVGPSSRFKHMFYNENPTEALKRATPANTDDRLWHHATRNNPNPDKYVPVQVDGFDQLAHRNEMQLSVATNLQKTLDTLIKLVQELQRKSDVEVKAKAHVAQRTQPDLKRKLFRVMRKLEMAKSRGLTLSDEEEAFRVKIEALWLTSQQPAVYGGKLTEISAAVRSRENAPGSQALPLDTQSAATVHNFLSDQQKGLEQLIKVVNEDVAALSVLLGKDEAELKEN